MTDDPNGPPPEDDETAELDEVGRLIYEDWRAAKDAAEQWRERQDNLAALLVEQLGGKPRAAIGGRVVVSWTPPGTVNNFDQRRFRENFPALWADYVTPSNRRGMLRLPPKPKAER